MENIIGNRHIWQCILAFATDGAFILDVQRDDGKEFTHSLASLRRTCKAMRDMIPKHTSMHSSTLLFESVSIGSCALCEFAYNRLWKSVDEDLWCFAPELRSMFDLAVSLGHSRIVEFFLTTPSHNEFDTTTAIRRAAEKNQWDVCDVIMRVVPNIEPFVMEMAGSKRRTDIIDKMKLRGISCHFAFAAAANAGHTDLCTMMINAGDITLASACDWLYQSARSNINICALYRECLKRTNRLDAEFYNHVMSQYSFISDAQLLQRLHAWSVEDGIRPDYVEILLRSYADNTYINSGIRDLIRNFAHE